jgi:hypothetical protein
MDRFPQPNDFDWNTDAYSEGYCTRQEGREMVPNNPYERNSLAWKSFNAGWADADMDPDCRKIQILD